MHPETQQGEVFFTNTDSESFGTMNFQSKRKGNAAYDGEGRPTSSDNWFPVFVQQFELEKQNLDLVSLRREWRKESHQSISHV